MKKYIFITLLLSSFSFIKAQTILMDTFSGSFCAGESFYVHIHTTGSFPPGNYFIAEISAPNGIYYNVYISSVINGTPDSILCELNPPYFPTTETGYRIRVRNAGSTNYYSNDNGHDLTIYAQPSAPVLSVSGSGCTNRDSITLTDSGGELITWNLPGNTQYSSTDSIYNPQIEGDYTATYTSSVATGSCISPVSNTVTILPSQTAVFIDVYLSVCEGMENYYEAYPVNGGSNPGYQWYLNNTPVGTNADYYIDNSATNTDSIKVTMTSNATCATGVHTSAAIAAAVYPVPDAPELTVSGHACTGADSLTVDAGSSFGVQWYQGGTLVSSWEKAYTVAGGTGVGSDANQMGFPNSIYVDGSGNVYVPDIINGRVQKFPAGSVSGTDAVTVAANGLSIPLGVYVDGSGNLYVAEADAGVILKYPAGSTASTPGVVVAGNPHSSNNSAANDLSSPVAVFVDGNGNVYVADDYNARVQKFPAGSDSLTNAVTVAKKNLLVTGGVYVDHNGNVYVSDYVQDRVWKFPAGSDSTTTGTIVAAHGLDAPNGLYVDGSNNLYVADINNNRVLKFPAGSDSSTVGVVVAGGTVGSGPTQLDAPAAVFVDGSNNIYVVDQNNNRVQKWIPGVPDTIYTPATAGNYAVTYRSVEGCISELSDTIVIHPAVTPTPVVDRQNDTLSTGTYTGYQWLDDGNPVNNAIAQTYIAPQGGTYNVRVTDVNGCTATSAPITVFGVGIHGIGEEKNISLYPNPNHGSFILDWNGGSEKEYIITDITGKVIVQQLLTSGKQAITLENTPAGVYTLQVVGGEAVRLVVE